MKFIWRQSEVNGLFLNTIGNMFFALIDIAVDNDEDENSVYIRK